MKPVSDPAILEALEGAPAPVAGPRSPSGTPFQPISDPDTIRALEGAAAIASPTPPEPRPPQGDGIGRNVAAGINETIAGMAGALPKLFNDRVNDGVRLINSLFGTNQRTVEMPVGAPESIKDLAGVAGIDPRDVRAVTPAERIGRSAGAGVAGMALPGIGAQAAVNAGIGAGRVAGAVLEGLAGPFPAAAGRAAAIGNIGANATMGATSGAAGQFAEEVTPAPGPGGIDFRPLARFAGEMVGGAVPAVAGAAAEAAGRAAWNGVRRAVEPFTIAGRELTVGRVLRDAASDPATAAGRMGDAPEIVPGSAPTTAQASGDAGLLALERGVARRNPAPFLERQADQNAARTAAMDALAPQDSRAGSVGEFLKAQAVRIERDADAAVQRAMDERAAALDEVGGAQPPHQYGAELRAELEAVKAAEKTALSEMYRQVDPGGTLALDIGGIQQAARAITRDLPKAASLTPAEQRLHAALAGMPRVERFGEVAALRSELTSAIRAERFTGGETPALRRMQQFRAAIDRALEGVAAPAAAPATTPPGAFRPVDDPALVRALDGGSPGAPSAAPRAADEITTASVGPLRFRWELVEGDTLRPAAGGMQPRDRGRVTSDRQVQDIATRLNPARLGASAELGSGAPIVARDGTVIDGNGRYLGVMQAHGAGGPPSRTYREWLAAQGFDPSGMRAPVLVRRLDAYGPDDLKALAREANQPRAMAYSATERAALDADAITDDVLNLYRGGTIDAAENAPMVRAFLANLDGNDLNAAVTAGRGLSLEGVRRLQGAFLARAYGDDGLVSGLIETGDEALRAFGQGLVDFAPAWAKLRGDLAAGRVQPSVDITGDILDAARIVRNARGKGIPLADAIAQQDAFRRISPATETLLRVIYGDSLAGRISRQRMADALQFYAQEAAQQTADARLFGDTLAAADILSTARVRYGSGQGTEAGRPGVADRLGPDDGTGGPEVRRNPAGAPGAGDAGRGAAGRGGALPEEALTPTFDAGAAARYRGANAAYRDFAERFKGGPVGNALRADQQGGYRVADSEVAGRFFHAGRRSREDLEAFIRAAGDRPAAARALLDYAASSLRAYAVKPDGALDPRKYGTWMNRHHDALNALDGLTGNAAMRDRFRRLADAQALVDEAGAEGKRTLQEFQHSAARFFLNDADPVKAVGSALASRNPRAAFAELAQAVKGDPDAVAGLRRAVLDHMRQTLRGNTEAGDTGLTLWHPDRLQTFLRTHEGALREVFGQQVEAIKAVAADIRRANRSVSGSKLPGGSDTAQNEAIIRKLPNGISVLQRLLAGASGAGGGALMGGPVGAGIGALGAEAYAMGRALGMAKVDALLTEAMLNPEVAALLLAKAPRSAEPQIMRRLARKLEALGLVSAADEAGGE